ncbi:Hypp288 [Branchiostoma lanceolatum]|uniref:Hypp288 protein n=1 Tax=Branchiostoma lanceolatum TaxID=7740 RepID=A0A8J9YIN9_BRALA|nr:Hypp288 [Branchiostoma lanceolatum]
MALVTVITVLYMWSALGFVSAKPFSPLNKTLNLPELHVRGTHYDVGYTIGYTFRERIQDFYTKYTLLHDVLTPFYKSEIGKVIVEGYLKVANDSFPQYVAELAGVSDGAGVPFIQAFLLTARHEILLIERKKDVSSCTDVFMDIANQRVLAHNEDAHPLVKEHAYLIHAQISPYKLPNGAQIGDWEYFTAYTYPGHLPGCAFGHNLQGMVFTVNAVFPKNVQPNKQVRYMLNRAMLAAKDPSEALDIITNKNGPGVASGFSVNIGYASDFSKLYNIEVAPTVPNLPQYYQTVLDVQGQEHYFHFNMYDKLNGTVPQYEDPSTEHRKARVAQMANPYDLKNIVDILGDTQDPDYPIFRTPNKKDDAETVATGIYDFSQGHFSVYLDNPKNTEGYPSNPIIQRFFPNY